MINFAVSKERIVLDCIKFLVVMKFRFNISELEFLKELEAGVLDVCPPDCYNVSELTGTQVRDLIEDVFDWIPLLKDRTEVWTFSNLGWRLTRNCL